MVSKEKSVSHGCRHSPVFPMPKVPYLDESDLLEYCTEMSRDSEWRHSGYKRNSFPCLSQIVPRL